MKKINLVVFILIAYITCIVIQFLFYYVIYSHNLQNDIWDRHIIAIIVNTLIIAPVYETFLCQSLPYWVINNTKIKKHKFYIYIVSSSVFFGLLHYHSIQYIVSSFLVGLVLSSTYYLSKIRRENSVINTILVHFLLNITAVIPRLF